MYVGGGVGGGGTSQSPEHTFSSWTNVNALELNGDYISKTCEENAIRLLHMFASVQDEKSFKEFDVLFLLLKSG